MLLTRLPLTPKDAFDLHVLSLPPAFVLSQDQTLKFKEFNLDITIESTEPHPSQAVSSKAAMNSQNIVTSIISLTAQTVPTAQTVRKNNRRLRFSSSRSTCQRTKLKDNKKTAPGLNPAQIPPPQNTTNPSTQISIRANSLPMNLI